MGNGDIGCACLHVTTVSQMVLNCIHLVVPKQDLKAPIILKGVQKKTSPLVFRVLFFSPHNTPLIMGGIW